MARHHILIGRIRFIMMAVTGGLCLFYAILVLITGQPDPISPWIPAVFGAVTALTIFVSFRLASGEAVKMTMDERYYSLDDRAHRIGYWTALFMYPIFGMALAHGYMSYYLVFPIMASLTGAAYLIPQVIMTGWDR